MVEEDVLFLLVIVVAAMYHVIAGHMEHAHMVAETATIQMKVIGMKLQLITR